MLSYMERGRLGAKNFWKKYKSDDIFRNKILEKWRKIRIRNYEKSLESFKKLNEEESEILKSRLCGFLAADGSVFIRKELRTEKVHYEIRFYPDDYALVELFNKSFERLYGKKVFYKQDGKYFRISISNKFAVRDLLSISKFSSKNWTLPKILKSKESKIEWLKAYFDCDGYVCKKYIQVQSVNKNGLNQISKLLKEFGIVSKIYVYERKQKSWNINYLLNINGKVMMTKFLKEIGFNHTLKKNKLQELIKAGVA